MSLGTCPCLHPADCSVQFCVNVYEHLLNARHRRQIKTKDCSVVERSFLFL